MATFKGITGTVTGIENFWTGNEATTGCFQIITVQGRDGNIVNFIISPDTYFVEQRIVSVGDMVTGFYDSDLPVPLIYPPQYKAFVMVYVLLSENVKVDFFDNQLISKDGMLKLNIGPYTSILLENGQPFIGNPANRNLIVIYGASTRSIPALTSPYKVIVMCG